MQCLDHLICFSKIHSNRLPFSPQLISDSRALHPLCPDAHFISIHPTTPSIRCTCLLGSIYHRNSLLIWVPLPARVSPLIIPLFLSSIFAHPSWSWIIPFSLPRLSLFVSLSSLLSPASSSLSPFLNPNAVSLSKCCWINHKESMNPHVFGDSLTLPRSCFILSSDTDRLTVFDVKKKAQ